MGFRVCDRFGAGGDGRGYAADANDSPGASDANSSAQCAGDAKPGAFPLDQ
jgi:hypothetical protein